MRKIKCIVIILAAIILTISILWQLAKIMAPGSYVYSESYEFDADEPELIASIESIKKEAPQYIVPEIYINGMKCKDRLSDGRSDSNDYWYHFYFYYPLENQIINFWSRPASKKGKTEIGFVAVNDGLEIGHWKEINEDLKGKENTEAKRKFEQRILNKIGFKYRDRGNSMSFWSVFK